MKATVPELRPPAIRLRRILVPVDFSDSSRIAVQFTAAFAAKFDATMILLHAVQLIIGGEEVGVPRARFLNELREAAEKRLSRLVRGMEENNVISRIAVCVGRPHLEILKQAQECNADLIIMASHGHAGWLRFLRPHTLSRVV